MESNKSETKSQSTQENCKQEQLKRAIENPIQEKF